MESKLKIVRQSRFSLCIFYILFLQDNEAINGIDAFVLCSIIPRSDTGMHKIQEKRGARGDRLLYLQDLFKT